MNVFEWLAIFVPYYLLSQLYSTWVIFSVGLGLQEFLNAQAEVGWLPFQHLRAVLKGIFSSVSGRVSSMTKRERETTLNALVPMPTTLADLLTI